jgi:hypothetical protein
MVQRVAFIVAELGAVADPFMLRIYAALAEKESSMIADRTRAALATKTAQGAALGNRTQSRRRPSQGRCGEPDGSRGLRFARVSDQCPVRMASGARLGTKNQQYHGAG